MGLLLYVLRNRYREAKHIDRLDLQKAIECHGFSFAVLVIREDAKTYKPRKEIFLMALKTMSLTPS